MENLGLTSHEAFERLARFGPNEIREKPRRSLLNLLLSQFTGFLVVLLILASFISFLLGDVLDGFFILLVVVLNGILGFIQEFKAEKAIEALKKITVSKIRVLRDGQETEIDSRFLVPGDIFFIEEGVKIPADARVVESLGLEVNEASLTGESVPVEKRADAIQDGKNLIFAGTVVARGRARAEVMGTGADTRFGRIAGQLQSIKEEETPLQKNIAALGRQLGFLGILASLLVFLLSILRNITVFESFLTSVSLAVASVPEGLPAVITIALAVGVQRMSQARVIVRKLTAVEALGSTSVIVTDKTGTLTRNEMKVKEVWFGGSFYSPKGLIGKEVTKSLDKIKKVSARCNNAGLVLKKDHGSFDVLGDPTEGALLLMIRELGDDIEKLRGDGRMVEEFPFDGSKKMMSVVWQDAEGTSSELLIKGAPESILALSACQDWGGESVSLNKEKKEIIEKSFKEAAAAGLRMIALAHKPLAGDSIRFGKVGRREELEKDLIFLGFVGIYDPPRPEVKEAVRVSREAGIRVVMVTGDNELTAAAVASEIGLLGEGEDVITGKQLDSFTPEALKEVLPKVRVFARTTLEHKLRIVKAYQEMGEVTAVTGDGVNDALALKQADVGAAMGVTGTDVAKEAADIVVADDNFASIAKAVEEGRVIFENVKGAVKYLLACNLGEVLAVIFSVLLGWPLIFTPLQLLYVNLITDGLPAVALSVSPAKDLVMKKRPRKRGGILGVTDLPWFLEISFLTTFLTLLAFYIGKEVDVSLGRTLAFTAVIFVQHFVFVDVWVKEQSPFRFDLYKSPVFLLAFFLPLIIHPFLLYIPYLTEVFKIASPSVPLLAVVILLSFVTFIVSWIRKSLLGLFEL